LYYRDGEIKMNIAGIEAAFATVAKICGCKDKEKKKTGCS
jgi:hypothetical protein